MPLADRIRPATLNDVVGQSHLIGKKRPLTKIIESGRIPNMIFYGPSGVGKTTVARIIADSANMRLHKLNGTNASTADIKSVVSEVDTFLGCNGILLYLDEIQYLNKKQQQSLLEYIEDGSITLIASTTENPYFYVYNAILSRSTVFEFKPVQPAELEKAIRRGFSLMTEETGVEYHLDDEAVRYISRGCGGDVRKSLNTVELCALTCTDGEITLELAQELQPDDEQALLLALAAAQCALHALEAERFAAAQQLARQALSWNEASLYGHAQVRLEMLRVLARCAEQTGGDAEAAFAAYRAAYTELQPAVPYHLCMARYQLIQEHLPAAEHEIWSIADLPETSRAEYLILRGRLACKKEQYETAAEYLRQADALGPLPKLLERELCQSMELASRELQDYKTAYEYAARQLKL